MRGEACSAARQGQVRDAKSPALMSTGVSRSAGHSADASSQPVSQNRELEHKEAAMRIDRWKPCAEEGAQMAAFLEDVNAAKVKAYLLLTLTDGPGPQPILDFYKVALAFAYDVFAYAREEGR